MDIPEDRYREIAREISSDESPVGIDAARTHVMILYVLDDIVRRLERLEAALESRRGSGRGPT